MVLSTCHEAAACFHLALSRTKQMATEGRISRVYPATGANLLGMSFPEGSEPPGVRISSGSESPALGQNYFLAHTPRDNSSLAARANPGTHCDTASEIQALLYC